MGKYLHLFFRDRCEHMLCFRWNFKYLACLSEGAEIPNSWIAKDHGHHKLATPSVKVYKLEIQKAFYNSMNLKTRFLSPGASVQSYRHHPGMAGEAVAPQPLAVGSRG